MNKRWFVLIVVVCMIVALLIPACATPAPAPVPTPAPSPAPTPAAKPITLKLGSDTTPASYYNQAADWWCKEIAKATEGRVVIDQYHNSTLAAGNAAIDSLNGGMVDIYIISITTFPGIMPVSQVFCLPGLAFPSTPEGKTACAVNYPPLFEKFSAVSNEWKNLKWLYANPGPTFHIISKSKEIHTPADISGLKVGGLGARQDILKVFGAAPVAAPPPQSYQMLQTGVVDAFCSPWVAVNDFQLWEVVKYQVDADTGESGMVTTISQNSWNKISPGDQKIIMDLASKAPAKATEALIKDQEAAKKKFLDYGRTMITLTAQERAVWQEKTKEYWDDWIAKTEAKGITGVKDVFNARKAAADAAWAKK